MKFSALALSLVLGGGSAAEFFSSSDAAFRDYLANFDKAYSELEIAVRYKLWSGRVEEVNSFNAEGKKSFARGLNQFTDMTEEEIASFRGFSKSAWRKSVATKARGTELKMLGMPSSFDWRDEGKVTPVKNQASCGSCWAFSGVGTIESNLLMNNQTETILSEQQFVDCMPNPEECGGTGGCEGATQPLLFDYALTAFTISEQDYPYTAHDGVCTEDSKPIAATVEGYGILPENCAAETLKAYLLKFGPIAVSVDASHWSSYSSGVLSYDACGADIDHAVLLTGYGTDPNLGDYWSIKNSWGASWGENGYIRISREDGVAVDDTPQDGVACEGAPPAAEVRGTCGVLYANSYVYGATVASSSSSRAHPAVLGGDSATWTPEVAN